MIGNPKSHIAICTIASKLNFPKDLFAICGEMRTENLGVERVVINTISNSHIRYLIICGKESQGHSSGQTLKALWENGINEEKRIIGSKGAIPYVENLTEDAIKRFQKQIIKVIDLIGEVNEEKIINVIKNLPKEEPYPEGYFLVKEMKEGENETSEFDVTISENIYLDPVKFIVGD